MRDKFKILSHKKIIYYKFQIFNKQKLKRTNKNEYNTIILIFFIHLYLKYGTNNFL